MSQRLFSMIAETHLHPGEGQYVGAVDQPVAREAVTGIPFVAGHSHKGAIKTGSEVRLQSLWSNSPQGGTAVADAFRDALFGDLPPVGAGHLIVGDIRLVAVPLRAEGLPFVYATSPHILNRLVRDLKFAGHRNAADFISVLVEQIDFKQSDQAILPNEIIAVHGFEFISPANTPDERAAENELRQELADLITGCLAIPPQTLFLRSSLAVFDDRAFDYLVQNALPVRARNQLDDQKRSKNLWYEETLPPDTLMTTLLGHRGMISDPEGNPISPVDIVINTLTDSSRDAAYLQIGGNETVGQGWVQINETRELSRKKETTVDVEAGGDDAK